MERALVRLKDHKVHGIPLLLVWELNRQRDGALSPVDSSHKVHGIPLLLVWELDRERDGALPQWIRRNPTRSLFEFIVRIQFESDRAATTRHRHELVPPREYPSHVPHDQILTTDLQLTNILRHEGCQRHHLLLNHRGNTLFLVRKSLCQRQRVHDQMLRNGMPHGG
eukprot:CAMPEP_0196193036 /NCGR_PEP_ID=MMETSP0911-20130528/49332_1 /TAXON_ID=49265 /ORGANISM="Thalassiosira rotula, Strain GSO102" /LENGTH=166 /DNA_ID=CAMNT_0041465253 /DNA_START=455 /DNA_END=954 /DNA_ORIENTATION=+